MARQENVEQAQGSVREQSPLFTHSQLSGSVLSLFNRCHSFHVSQPSTSVVYNAQTYIYIYAAVSRNKFDGVKLHLKTHSRCSIRVSSTLDDTMFRRLKSIRCIINVVIK